MKRACHWTTAIGLAAVVTPLALWTLQPRTLEAYDSVAPAGYEAPGEPGPRRQGVKKADQERQGHQKRNAGPGQKRQTKQAKQARQARQGRSLGEEHHARQGKQAREQELSAAEDNLEAEDPEGQDVQVQAPAPEAPPVARAHDPVYEAWEEFLKQRGGGAPQLPLPGEAVVAEPTPEQTMSQGTTLQMSSMGAGPWGGVVATVFGGMGLAGAYVARKRAPKLAEWIRSRSGGGSERERVKVVSVNPLSSQGSIAVVEVFDEILVLGVTSGRVSLLTRINRTTGRAEDVLDREPPLPPPAPVQEAQPSARVSQTRPRQGQEFNALLDNLMPKRQELEDNADPIARYLSMQSNRRESSFEPPMEDMAGQVLRKMRTLKRFRPAA